VGRGLSVSRWGAGLASALFAAIILAHAALLPGGRWDGDEYFNFASLRDQGFGFAWRRLYEWSPRPFSEAVLWAYDGAVTLTGTPLILPFLALLWAVPVGGGVWALWRPYLPGAPWRLAVALCVPAVGLLAPLVTEMFYWPMAAAPYLLAMAGIVVVTFRLMAGGVTARRERWVCGLALTLAVGSSETGLFFVVGFSAILALSERRGAAWYLLPLLLAVLLLAEPFAFRVAGAVQPLVSDHTYFHRLLPSTLGALEGIPGELFGEPYVPGPGPYGFFVGAALLFLGFCACLRVGLPDAVPWRYLVALAGGLLASAFGSMVAALYQYGLLCCGRHYTFRHGLVVLLVLVAARAAAQWQVSPRVLPRLAGPVLLMAAAGMGLSTRVPGLIHDVGLLGIDVQASAANWATLRDPAAAPVFRLPARGLVITGLDWPPGHYAREGAPWFVAAMLTYFGRTEVDVVAPLPEKSQ
jgi:hypothetical protein